MLLLLSIIFSSTSAFAETVNYDVIIDPALNLTLSSNTVSFNLNPVSQAFNSGNLTATVSTNNPNGYKLYLNANTTDLVRQNDGTAADSLNAVIETLSSSTTETNFPVNKWGYRISSGTSGDSTITSTTNYFPFVSNKLISSTIEPTNSESATLSFAAKADYNKPAGQYNLSLNFKALPIVTQTYMQDIEPSDCTADPTIVLDKRDEQFYTIRRINGNCWMTDNLRLGLNPTNPDTTTITLTPQDSNVTETRTITAYDLVAYGNSGKKCHGYFNYAESGGDGFFTPCMHSKDITSGNNTIGVWYNYAMATAGTIANAGNIANTDEAIESICPKNWELPNLTQYQTITDNVEYAAMFTPILGGSYSGATLNNAATDGYLWVSTASSEYLRYYIDYNASYNLMWSGGFGGRQVGQYVRCILQE